MNAIQLKESSFYSLNIFNEDLADESSLKILKKDF